MKRTREKSQISLEIQVKKQQRSSRKGDKGTQDESHVLVGSPYNSPSIPSDQSSVSLVVTKKRRKSAGVEKKNEVEGEVEDDVEEEGDKEGGEKKSGLNLKNSRKSSSGTQSTISSDEESENEEGEEEEELPCEICGDADATSKNHIIMCDGPDCDIPVHQGCYRVEKIPPGDEKWFCQRCEDGVAVDETDIICCKSKTGAFFKTTFPKKYIHAVCALWNNSVELLKSGAYTVEKWLINKEICYLCGVGQGLTIRCKYPGCKKWFHVSCAVDSGLIELCRPRYIKHNVFCGDSHDQPIANPNVSASSSSGKNENVDKERVESEGLKRKKHGEMVVKKSDVKEGSVQLSNGSMSGPSHALSWLSEKVNALKEVIDSLENIPVEVKKSFRESNISASTSSPLDSIFDKVVRNSNYVTTNSELLDQIASLKKELAARPSAEELNRLISTLKSVGEVISSGSIPSRVLLGAPPQGVNGALAITPVSTASPIVNLLNPSSYTTGNSAHINLMTQNGSHASNQNNGMTIVDSSSHPVDGHSDEGSTLDLCVKVFNFLSLQGLDLQPVTRATLKPFLISLHALLEKESLSQEHFRTQQSIQPPQPSSVAQLSSVAQPSLTQPPVAQPSVAQLSLTQP